MLTTCSQSIFLYNDHVYRQHDGVAMGSPLAPLLAEWFMCNMEEKIFKECTSYEPIYYRRYVDDIFALFRSPSERDLFFEKINKIHKNLAFTMEVSTSSLPFLDTSVSVKEDKFDFKVYRKPTNTGVVLNFNAMAPRKWKTSLIRCLLTRALKLSSSWELFQTEISVIKEILNKNSYPTVLVEKKIAEFITEQDINPSSFTRACLNKRESPEKKQNNYVLLPYLGKPSVKLQKRISDEMRQYDVNVTAAYSTTKVESYFSLKTKMPLLFKSNVVYRFSGSCDKNVSYIGETRRQLFVRIKEHQQDGNNSAVFSHLYDCSVCQNINNITKSFDILCCGSKFNVLQLESLSIGKHQPSLNKQMGPSKGTISLRLFS